MIWSKMKQQLESFLAPALAGRVEYRATSYRYAPDKSGRCYITVDKREVFNMCDISTMIKWYSTEQEIKNDLDTEIQITEEDIDRVRRDSTGAIPEERLAVIARNRKISEYAKEIMASQAVLSKSDFYDAANRFLSGSIEECLNSKEILFNIFAIVDRRVGKKRLVNMKEKMKTKHPIVQYFYELRLGTM